MSVMMRVQQAYVQVRLYMCIHVHTLAYANIHQPTQGGYHGRTYGSMAVTSSKTIYRQMYGPLIPGIHITSYPYCLQCDVRRALPTSDYTV